MEGKEVLAVSFGSMIHVTAIVEKEQCSVSTNGKEAAGDGGM